MLKKIGLLVFVTILVISCNDDCSENVDAPPSPSVFVDVVNNATNNSVFTDSIYFAGETTVRNYLDADIPFSMVDSLNIMHIVLENEVIVNDTIFINLNNSIDSISNQIKILYSTEVKHEECYSLYKTTNISVFDFENEFVDGIYKIKVD